MPPPVEHPADGRTCCTTCAAYITWLEGELLRTVEFYNGLVDVMGTHAQVTEAAGRMAALFNQSRDVVQSRRLREIERHLSEGDDPQR